MSNTGTASKMSTRTPAPETALRQERQNSWLWGPFSRFGVLIAVALVAIDQLNKCWMLAVLDLPNRGRVQVLPILDLIYVKNRGISYGLLTQDSALGQWLLTGFAIVCTIALLVWLARPETSRVLAVSLGLIIGGALGNALDRLLAGGVHDFYSLHAFGYYWYVFNIADAAIVAGVGGLLYDSLTSSRKGAVNRP
jgi:signal peptidase II